MAELGLVFDDIAAGAAENAAMELTNLAGQEVAAEQRELVLAAGETSLAPLNPLDGPEITEAKVKGNPLASSLWAKAKDFAAFTGKTTVVASIFFAVTYGLNKAAKDRVTSSGGKSRQSLSDYISAAISTAKNMKPYPLIDGDDPEAVKKYEQEIAESAMLVPYLVDLTK